MIELQPISFRLWVKYSSGRNSAALDRKLILAPPVEAMIVLIIPLFAKKLEMMADTTTQDRKWGNV